MRWVFIGLQLVAFAAAAGATLYVDMQDGVGTREGAAGAVLAGLFAAGAVFIITVFVESIVLRLTGRGEGRKARDERVARLGAQAALRFLGPDVKKEGSRARAVRDRRRAEKVVKKLPGTGIGDDLR